MPHQHPSWPLEIARRLRDLADEMDSIAIDLDACADLPDGSDCHVNELAAAAKVARQWACTLQAHVAEARDDG